MTHHVLLLDPASAADQARHLGDRLVAEGITVLGGHALTDPVAHTRLDVATQDGGHDALRDLVAGVAPENSAVLPASCTARLVVFDVDSTLITGEVVEMLADRTGRRAQVERITAAAMRGEMDFAASLRERVALLAGLDAAVLDEVGASLVLTPGAQQVVEACRARGWRCGIVSGGFTQVTRYLLERLDLDFCAANTLEVAEGRLTGGLLGTIVDRAGKESALRRFAADAGVPMERTVAVGDGANDLDMIEAAALGVAFNAKPVVAERADVSVRGPSLLPVLALIETLTAQAAPRHGSTGSAGANFGEL